MSRFFLPSPPGDSRLYLADLEKMCLADSVEVLKMASRKDYLLIERGDYFLFSHQNTSLTNYSDASLILWRQGSPNQVSDDKWQILYSYPDVVHSAALQTAIGRSKRYAETVPGLLKGSASEYTALYQSDQFVIALDVADELVYKNGNGSNGKNYVFKIKRK